MGYYSSLNKQLRNEITARVEIKKEIKTLKADIVKNIEEIYIVDIEIKRIKKPIIKRKKKNK